MSGGVSPSIVTYTMVSFKEGYQSEHVEDLGPLEFIVM